MTKQKSPRFLPLVLSAMCLALCMVLPLLTGQIPQVGSALCPMHIPVLLCGLLCGPFYGLAVGAVAPLLRFVLFGMPPLFPTGTAMCFELAAYGFLSGWLCRLLPRKPLWLYITLIAAMLGGRVVWGLAQLVLLGLSGKSFTLAMFLAGAFTNALPGIILHIVLIPPLVLALRKALPDTL